MPLRFLDGGESHGKALIAVLEGIPSNYEVDIDYIDNELKRRQQGYGRGKRMKIERDKVDVWSGLRGNKTTGNPITFIIKNKDYENWREYFENDVKPEERIGVARPGHGDLVGFHKYKTGDMRDSIERTSARETAIRCAVGALCKQMLLDIGIDIRSKVYSLGEFYDQNIDLFNDENYSIIEESSMRCYNKHIEDGMKSTIDMCKEEGDTIGGRVYIGIKGVPIGIGSYSNWDRKLDGILSMAIMSVQAVKAVSFGKTLDLPLIGSIYNDEAYFEEGTLKRASNNCGGIEAGISNGENIEMYAVIKPIPSVKKGLNSVDLIKKENVTSRYERSDISAVVPACIVLENVCAFHILDEILKKFPSDDFNELKENIERYRSELLKY
ncbi:chorismate synthase [Clostridium algidicarnis]|uniref:Chorismate synthase n=1 Tax=Clostridium algidicarnis DSM 15099 TaxID=1121295 RepID=A0A2S6FWM3_9CLOT|nr:chorismate synthase [Clostridium algidicarnis]MBB6697416.1 chorismate synthase [Clostridium algidicarnis]MBU3202683.1 chorismate synthase [Clostridium algidicarnis]MBU3210837.1 chorismate synthase [Clostridium algidicarnis]MBU3222655.1 chorismate synthase [Clostridium algidicarnis]PPK47993.1 chorismate synthase [Clostridium algidicarnis DSM 15099]